MAPLTPSSVALITASSAGLGAATARLFASHGIRVIINYNSSAQKAETLVKELAHLDSSKDGNPKEKRYTAICADMSQKSEVQKLVKKSVEVMGRLDVGMSPLIVISVYVVF